VLGAPGQNLLLDLPAEQVVGRLERLQPGTWDLATEDAELVEHGSTQLSGSRSWHLTGF